MAEYNTKRCKYIQLGIDSDLFGTLYHISSMNKKSGSKSSLNPKAPFKWVFMDMISSTAPKILQVRPLFLIIF